MPTTVDDDLTVRSRLLAAMAECLLVTGYRATTIADIVRVARTSKRSFYDEFSDKQECYLELMAAVNGDLLAAIERAVDPAAPWQEQVQQAVRTYLEMCEANPGITCSWIRELPALGDSARELQSTSIEAFAALLARLTSTEQFRAAGIAPMTREVAFIVWGGIRELAVSAIERGLPLRSFEAAMISACVALADS